MTNCIIAALLSTPFLMLSVEPHARSNLQLEVEAKATIERTDYQPMEPIWVRFEVSNETAYTWFVLSENVLRIMSIEVEKDGDPVGATAYNEFVRTHRLPLEGTEVIEPGKTFWFSGRRVPVNWVRDMTAPGEYSIRLSVPFFFAGEDDKSVNGRHIYSSGVVRANPVTVRVSGRPRPPEAP